MKQSMFLSEQKDEDGDGHHACSGENPARTSAVMKICRRIKAEFCMGSRSAEGSARGRAMAVRHDEPPGKQLSGNLLHGKIDYSQYNGLCTGE